jgi:hypothetical protein
VLENIQPNQHLKTCYSFGLAIAVACILVWPMQTDQTQQDKTCHSYPSHLLIRIRLGSNLLEGNQISVLTLQQQVQAVRDCWLSSSENNLHELFLQIYNSMIDKRWRRKECRLMLKHIP